MKYANLPNLNSYRLVLVVLSKNKNLRIVKLSAILRYIPLPLIFSVAELK